MAAVGTHEAFSMTPPPSEFDEFDKTGLLTCSPSLPGLCYPSPTPSHQGHAPAGSSDSIYMLPELSMSDGQDHDLKLMSFGASTSDPASFYQISQAPDAPMTAYDTSAPGSFNMFEHNQWFHYPGFSQQSSMYDSTGGHSYPTFDGNHTQPSMTNIIPPTPQDIQPSFDFNNPASTIPSNHLSASPAFSHISHSSVQSHRTSMSSMSRSCSPSLQYRDVMKGHSADPAAFRPSIRSNSTSSNSSLHAYGIPVTDPTQLLSSSSMISSNPNAAQAWRCAYPGCTSRATFTRGCDLRKHYNRHSKHLFCRVDGCPQSEAAAAGRAKSADQPLTGGFSSKKDRARHEAKHNPGIKCEWRGAEGEECGRVFSRMDNMKDHVRRIHNKGQKHPDPPSSSRK